MKYQQILLREDPCLDCCHFWPRMSFCTSALLQATGAALAAVNAEMEGSGARHIKGFVPGPPGHHATKRRPKEIIR